MKTLEPLDEFIARMKKEYRGMKVTGPAKKYKKKHPKKQLGRPKEDQPT